MAFLPELTRLHLFVVTLRCEHSCPYGQVSRQNTPLTALYGLGLMISVALEFQHTYYTQLVSVSCKRGPMYKTPAQIARSLRAFRNAHRMGLLRSVRISPGHNACKAALSQTHVEYMGNAVPRLPLSACTRAKCECTYVPVGGGKLMDRLRAIAGTPSGRPLK